MNSEKRFEFLEHTADAYIAAFGKNLATAFENAALAMFQVMTDVNKIEPKLRRLVKVTGKDNCELLYRWLEALLVDFDVRGMLFSKFALSSIQETQDGLELEAEAWGENFSPERHVQKVGVKAVTYHRMEIIRQPGKVTVKFILDI